MTITSRFTIADLKRILVEGSGEPETSLDADILDTSFDDLGYDSLAILETAGRVEREFGVRLDTAEISGASTPRRFLATVNEQIL